MGKTSRPQQQQRGERAYGRITLSDLTNVRVAEWTVRAVAGEHRQFVRAAPSTPLTAAAVDEAAANALARLALQTSALHDGTQKLIGLRCGTCEIAAFDSLDAQHAHFKTDWHCLNLKRKGKGLAVVTSEADALALLATSKTHKHSSQRDADASGYASSSSSASSSGASDVGDDDDVYTTTEPVVEFSDGKSVFKVFKTILPGADTESFDPYAALDNVRASRFKWAVLLLRSGRFAGAIFERETALCHKTFQRYTVRRKQGGSQSANDASGGKAKSAGATLRRYNEAALKQDVADLLVQWRAELASVDLIFIASGKTDRATFFGGKTPVLEASDPRLRRIPFATFRPTFEELCRVRAELSSVRFAPLPATPSPSDKPAKAAKAKAKMSDRASDATTDGSAQETAAKAEKEEETVEPLPLIIQLAVDGALSELKALESITSDDVNAVDATHLMTALHYAAANDAAPIVTFLLEHGANPSLLDLRSRPAYALCSAKETRNAFRRFLAEHPDAWDYTASQIPTALTTEMEQKKKDKEAEKRRRAKERKKQQKREAADAQARETAQREEAERQAAVGKACDACGKFAGKSPLLRLEYKYCSSECVLAHKRELMREAALRRFGN